MSKKLGLAFIIVSILMVGIIVVNFSGLWDAEVSDYDDMRHINDFSELEAYDEEDTMYLLYIYATWCGSCQAILLDVLDFVESHDETIPIVFAEEGANGTPPVEWSYYPSMIVMQSGEVLEGPIVGSSDILALFDEIIDSTYTPYP